MTPKLVEFPTLTIEEVAQLTPKGDDGHPQAPDMEVTKLQATG